MLRRRRINCKYTLILSEISKIVKHTEPFFHSRDLSFLNRDCQHPLYYIFSFSQYEINHLTFCYIQSNPATSILKGAAKKF